MTIGEAIKDARIKAGVTQAELAERLGISPQAVSQYERGKKNPRLSTIQKFADALGIDVSDLLDVVKIFSMDDGTITSGGAFMREFDEHKERIRKALETHDLAAMTDAIEENLSLVAEMQNASMLMVYSQLTAIDKERALAYCQGLLDAHKPPLKENRRNAIGDAQKESMNSEDQKE